MALAERKWTSKQLQVLHRIISTTTPWNFMVKLGIGVPKPSATTSTLSIISFNYPLPLKNHVYAVQLQENGPIRTEANLRSSIQELFLLPGFLCQRRTV